MRRSCGQPLPRAITECPENDGLVRNRKAVGERLAAMADGSRVVLAGGRAVLPADTDDLADVLASEPTATVVAGATDVGVWINKDLRDIAPAVFIGHLDGLGRIGAGEEAIEIGAAVSYSDAEAALTEAVPGLAEYWRRIGGWQIRNMGTVGGNIANGSPIADLPPVLIALGAELVLRKGRERRILPLEEYFIAYGRQDLGPGEFVEAVRVPRPASDAMLGFYKVSKRRDEDISSVCAGFMVRVREGRIEDARLAFGGMAATPRRAGAGEAALLGQEWDESRLRGRRAGAGPGFHADFRLARVGGVPGAGSPEPPDAFLSGPFAGSFVMTGPATREHMHRAYRHDSAGKHVTGRATYADDIVEPAGTLHACLGLSAAAHAGIVEMDLSAVGSAPGVVGVLTAADIPGENDIGPTGAGDDPVFADGVVSFYGQPMFAVVARTRAEARKAVRFAEVVYEKRPAVIDTDEAVDTVTEPLTLKRGDVEAALRAAPRRLQGTLRVGGQDHFYLESHIALALPGEDNEVRVVSSTQHPSEVQHMVGHVLGVPSSAVTVTVRRMGGAFGGKETQSNLFAAVAALAARKFGRAVKLRPDRDDDMTATGKRHDFRVDYDVGFDDEGRILAVDGVLAARCGFSADLSGAVADRALFHADNAYFFPAVRLRSRPMRTNTVSNTAFRGFGSPQGVMAAERIVEEIAYSVPAVRRSMSARRTCMAAPAGT